MAKYKRIKGKCTKILSSNNNFRKMKVIIDIMNKTNYIINGNNNSYIRLKSHFK